MLAKKHCDVYINNLSRPPYTLASVISEWISPNAVVNYVQFVAVTKMYHL